MLVSRLTLRMFAVPLILGTGLLAAPLDDEPEKKAGYVRELETLRRTKPADYENVRAMLTLNAELLLARLGYGTGPMRGILDENLRNALKRYEENRKLPITGDPLV